MARRKKTFDDDDGRTIVDMSGVERPNLWGFRFPESAPSKREEPREQRPDRPWDTSNQISGRERLSLILGALGAAFLVALPFGIVFAIAIWIIGHGLF